jgi:hypothetical protein
MVFVWLIPVFLSLLLLGAHFLFHTGQVAIAIIPLLFVVPLMFRKSWVPWLTQLVLLLGTMEWLRTLYVGVNRKLALGADWQRYTLILGAVTLFTALSCLVFRSKGLRARYSETS